MKIFYLFIFLLISEFAFAQACPPDQNRTTKIKLRCKVGERDTANKPLWIVDGIVVAEEQVAKLDPIGSSR